jgi:PhnO protein
MEYNIRKAGKEDVHTVYNLICQLKEDTLDMNIFIKKFNRNLNESGIEYWLMESKLGDLPAVGFASIHANDLLHHNDRVYEIQEFIIDTSHRGKGLGTFLINFISARFGTNPLELASNKSRINTMKFYEKRGFKNTHNKFVFCPDS